MVQHRKFSKRTGTYSICPVKVQKTYSYVEKLMRAILIRRRNSTLPGDTPGFLPEHHQKLISSTIAIENPPPHTNILIKDKVSRKWYWRLWFYWHCIWNVDVFLTFLEWRYKYYDSYSPFGITVSELELHLTLLRFCRRLLILFWKTKFPKSIFWVRKICNLLLLLPLVVTYLLVTILTNSNQERTSDHEY